TEVARFLIDSGIDVDTTSNGKTPLIFAAQNGKADTVTALIRAGADPNFVVNSYDTALTLAAKNGSASTVRALLAAGVDPNDEFGKRALVTVVASKRIEVVRVFLFSKVDLETEIGS